METEIIKKESILTEISFTDDYVSDIKAIFSQSRQYVKNHVNYAMVLAYWLTGKKNSFAGAER